MPPKVRLVFDEPRHVFSGDLGRHSNVVVTSRIQIWRLWPDADFETRSILVVHGTTLVSHAGELAPGDHEGLLLAAGHARHFVLPECCSDAEAARMAVAEADDWHTHIHDLLERDEPCCGDANCEGSE